MKIFRYIFNAFLILLLVCCTDVLEIEPKNKLSADALFSSPGGVKAYMANLYFQLPIEDFTYFPRAQVSGGNRRLFNFNGSNPNNAGYAQAMMTDNAANSDHGSRLSQSDYENWWEEGYKLIRDVNTLIGVIPDLDILEEQRDLLIGEAAFIRAYAYFGLAKRYGGVPLITEAQEYTTDVEGLRVPRSTEDETWAFILEECDRAIAHLGDGDGFKRRADKWVAYALKSRVALHAASLAKYWNEYAFSGEAADKNLVGIDASRADFYYAQCIEASEAMINSGRFGLFRPNPANPQEAAENYRQLFEDPDQATQEAIFIKGYTVISNDHTANNYEIWYNPNQTSGGWPHPGRMSPTLNLVDAYEDYNFPGEVTLLQTTEDGNEDYFGYDASINFRKFDTPNEIYKDKDARLWGTAILPGTIWKNTEIVIQAGFIEPNGTPRLLTRANTTVNGVTYHTYGAANAGGYSGFDPAGGNHTRTGLGFKKFLKEAVDVNPAWNQGTLDYMDFRYAEILLNYAEAVVESGLGDPGLAQTVINDIRRRAGHTSEIPLTLDNVMRERRVEMAFEHKRWWDLVRRREFHEKFNNFYWNALLPVLDLREDPPKYIMVRDRAPNYTPQTWNVMWYYRGIPGIGASGLVQNPMY